MQFDSLAALMSMGGHGPYVWSAYGIFILVLAGLIIWCLQRRAAIIQQLLQQAQLEPEAMADTQPAQKQNHASQPTEGVVQNGNQPNKEQP